MIEDGVVAPAETKLRLSLILANGRGSEISVENYFKHVYAFQEEKRKHSSEQNLFDKYHEVLWNGMGGIVLAVAQVQERNSHVQTHFQKMFFLQCNKTKMCNLYLTKVRSKKGFSVFPLANIVVFCKCKQIPPTH